MRGISRTGRVAILALLSVICAPSAHGAVPSARALLQPGGEVVPTYPVAGGGATTAVGYVHAGSTLRAVDQAGQELWQLAGPGEQLYGGFDFDQDGWPDVALVVRQATSQSCGAQQVFNSRIRIVNGRTGQPFDPIASMADYCYVDPNVPPYTVTRWSSLAPLFGPGPELAFAPQYHTTGWFIRYANNAFTTDSAFWMPNTANYNNTYPTGSPYRNPSHVLNGLITTVSGERRLVAWTSKRVAQYRVNRPLGASQLVDDVFYTTGGRTDMEGRNYGLVTKDPASGKVILLAGTDALTVFEDLRSGAITNDPWGGIERHLSIYDPAVPDQIADRFFSFAKTDGQYRGRVVYPANPLVSTGSGASRIAYNVYWEPGETFSRWNLHISAPGSTGDISRIHDRFLWDVRDIDADGIDDWITSPICDPWPCPNEFGQYFPRKRIEIYHWNEATRQLALTRRLEGVFPYLHATFRTPTASTTRAGLFPVLSVPTPSGLKLLVTRDGVTPELAP